MGMLQKINLLHYFFTVNKRGKFIAHCLNFDLVASADSCEEAESRLDLLVKFHIERYLKTIGMTSLGNRAPKEFWDKYTYSLRNGGALRSSTLRVEIPDIVPMPVPYGELEVVSAKAA